jgi:pimeloyl-ACP methyl ester carboxylesterase
VLSSDTLTDSRTLQTRRITRGATWLVIAGVAILAAAAGVENRIEAHKRALLSKGETFAEVDGWRVRYRLQNPERPGPTLVLLNGFFAAVEQWDHMLEHLQGVGPILMYDREGQGLSDGWGAPDAASMVRELDAVLRIPGVRPPFVLVGYSASGLLAEAFAKEHPKDVAGLVFLDTVMSEQLGTAGDEKRARGVYRGMVKLALQVTFGIARIRAWLHHEPPSRGDEIVLLASHSWELFREAHADSELARETLGFSAPRLPIAMLSTRGLETQADLVETYALQHRLAASSGHEIFRDLDHVAHDKLLMEERGLKAAEEIIRAELAFVEGPSEAEKSVGAAAVR